MDISPDKYRRQLKEAWAELHTFERVQRITEQRITDLRELIRANANFLPDSERGVEILLLDVFEHPKNIAEAVRSALLLSTLKDERLTPIQIKENAESRGFDFSEYTNPMASIHTTLRRMKEANPPEVSFTDDGGYMLTTAGYPSVSAALQAQVTVKTNERLLAAQPIDSERLKDVMAQVSAEIIGEPISRATKRVVRS